MKTRRVVATLTGHSDAVTCLLNDGKGTLYVVNPCCHRLAVSVCGKAANLTLQ